MSDSDKPKIDFTKVLRTSGYHLPIDDSEVESFEKNLRCEDDSKPGDWNNPLNILLRGRIEKVELSPPIEDPSTISNLALAARDGKVISEEVRKKMYEDRKNSKKK